MAYDVNPAANATYSLNFGPGIVSPKDLAKITSEALDEIDADLFVMSPPCQPYTRQGLERGIDDSRSMSLIAITLAIKNMRNPPSYILLENVKGFEVSSMRKNIIEILKSRGYHTW